jgi:hypothetical protein
MSFAAKYFGHCAAHECVYGDYRISQGESVCYVDDELMHVECAGRSRSENNCSSCGLQHRGECDW